MKNFERAELLFDTYLPPEKCNLSNKNKDDIIHYYITIRDRKGISDALIGEQII